ncbi:23087_t:CDS:2, partial [Cetraspora pellucida]
CFEEINLIVKKMSVQSYDSLQSQDISNTSLSTVNTSQGTIPKSIQCKVCIVNSEEAHDYIPHG